MPIAAASASEKKPSMRMGGPGLDESEFAIGATPAGDVDREPPEAAGEAGAAVCVGGAIVSLVVATGVFVGAGLLVGVAVGVGDELGEGLEDGVGDGIGRFQMPSSWLTTSGCSAATSVSCHGSLSRS